MSEARASLKDPSRPFTPAAMTRARLLWADDEPLQKRVEDELGSVACELKGLTSSPRSALKALETLRPWIEGSAFTAVERCRARADVVRSLENGLAHGDARVRVCVARDALSLLKEDDTQCEIAACRAIYEAEPELLFELEVVPVVVAKIAEAAQRLREQRVARLALVYLGATAQNLSAATATTFDRLGGLACAVCDLLRSAVDSAEASEERSELLTHLSAALRNACPSQVRQLETARGAVALAGALRAGLAEPRWPLVLNASRALARLSSQPRFFEVHLGGPGAAAHDQLVRDAQDALATAHAHLQTGIVVRLAFLLGNATADDARARMLVSVPRLVDLLATSAERDDEEQVVIKLVRIVANCAIEPTLGARAARLRGVIAWLPRLVRRAAVGRREELLLNVVAAITNLSYYRSFFDDDQATCSHLVDALLHPNHEIVCEAARAFGNLSRSAATRNIMRTVGADEALALLVAHHPSRNVVFAAVGSLVNLATDDEYPPTVKTSSVLDDLVNVLRRAGIQDLGLAAVACKAIHNFLLLLRPTEGERDDDRLWASLDELVEAAQHLPAAADDFISAARALRELRRRRRR
ncbi:hypothetical protein CTAYLR_008464 [Chrysophaeum taylorii]|uniref:Armadillo repeat-containing protein 8 n=1 Tax=Chrysophaeum taylorii TaxID=2483200 RepID=A0AAD7XJF3_9STRA|nr:hypothetical protein CTAYLR_008464 [Chrysophaeum taylorii]